MPVLNDPQSPAPRRKTGSHPVLTATAPTPEPAPIDYAALAVEVARHLPPPSPVSPDAARLLTAALAAVPPGAARWALGLLGVLLALYGAQLRALWGLPDRVAALEAQGGRVEAKLDGVSGLLSAPGGAATSRPGGVR